MGDNDDLQARWQLYRELVRDSEQDRRASSDEFDKAMLTLSSGALGLSLAFIKDIVPLKEAASIDWLYASWGCFILCIVVTVLSFRFSMFALEQYEPFLQRYYLEQDKSARNHQSIWNRLVTGCAWAGFGVFLAGLIFTVLFVSINISRIQKMADKPKQFTARATDARTTPLMVQPVEERGRTTSTMPVVPPQNNTPQNTQQPSSGKKK